MAQNILFLLFFTLLSLDRKKKQTDGRSLTDRQTNRSTICCCILFFLNSIVCESNFKIDVKTRNQVSNVRHYIGVSHSCKITNDNIIIEAADCSRVCVALYKIIMGICHVRLYSCCPYVINRMYDI